MFVAQKCAFFMHFKTDDAREWKENKSFVGFGHTLNLPEQRRGHTLLRLEPGTNRLFVPLPSGRRFRALRAGTKRLKDSFYPRAVKASPPADRFTHFSTQVTCCLTQPGHCTVLALLAQF